jgi:hypothetical protein
MKAARIPEGVWAVKKKGCKKSAGMGTMGKMKRWKWTILLSALLVMLAAMGSMAAEAGDVLSFDIGENGITLYVQSPGEPESVECQIGTTVCRDVSLQALSELGTPIRTLILVDNSLSIPKSDRPKIKEIMNNLVANRMDGEQISVAVFSDKISYLVEDSSDFTQLKQAIDGIDFVDQETYLTDVLYEVLAEWEAEQADGLRRIVVISDGVDNKSIGYTKEELYARLEARPYPVYAVGCMQSRKSNQEEIKNMFALSRKTKGGSWLLDETDNLMDIVSGVAACNHAAAIRIALPPEVCDGTKKGVLLRMTAGGQTLEKTVEMNMPFAAETEAESLTYAPEPETVTVWIQPSEAEPEPEPETGKWKWQIAAGIGGVIALLLIAGSVILIRLKKKRSEGQFEEAGAEARHESETYQAGEEKTMMFDDDNKTALFFDGSDHSYTLFLTDQENPARRFQVPLGGTVLLGRSREEGCQVVLEYDRYVSRRHCEIWMQGGQLKIRDIKASNHTLVNGKQIIGEADIYSGSVITVGKTNLKVELN